MTQQTKQSPLQYQIKSHRATSKMSQQECADSMGVSLRTWVRWESGITKMPFYGWAYFQTLSHEVNEVTASHDDKNRLTQLYDDMARGEQPDT
tara:strand:- start:28 stop:306 length:279 start_codon:yes stop_codon:yes gene_type:complete